MQPRTYALLRKLLPWTTVAVVITALYTGWVFYSRWRASQEYEQRQQAARAASAERERQMLSDTKLKVLNFSLTTSTIRRGQSASLCYGVANAKRVRIEPPVGDTWPSTSRCLEVSPRRDTTYKLTAEDDAGHAESAEMKLFVIR
jgi:hypothetical protein